MSDQFARVDFFAGAHGQDHVIAQYEPGNRDRLLRALLHLLDNLKSAPGVPFVQVVEVEQVKQ